MTKKNYALLLASALTLSAATSSAQKIMGVTVNNELFSMDDAANPSIISAMTAITGMTAGQDLVGTDFRPNTGELYALGYNSTTGAAQLYTINTTTAVATAVGAAMVLELGTGSVGFDFNPTVDRIRVTAANRKNYRLHPVTGAIAATDGELTFATGDISSTFMPTIGASAYTNSYIGTESTTLYNYDEALNIITTQVPPNAGTQNTVGLSGITVNPANKTIDMDIFFEASSSTNKAYLVANTIGNNDNLYTINLTSGAATLVGAIGGGVEVKDIAVVIDRTLPPVTGQMIYALTKTNSNFISFDSENPVMIRSLMPITGVTANQVVVGMDFRPMDRMLYALGYEAATMAYQLYTINTETGAATAVNATPGTIDLGAAGNVGFDFNPVPDRIRVVSGVNGNNYRLNPIDGSIGATDTALTYTAGDANEMATPYVGTVAYTNSFPGATATMMHGIDDTLKSFVSINPPNAGKVNTILANFLPLNSLDMSVDLDFYYDSTASANIGFLAANTGVSVNDDLYTIDMMGGTTLKGRIGFGVPVRDIAVKLNYTNTPVSVRNVNNNKTALSIYPNPTRETLYFAQLQAGKTAIATITDLSGRVLQTTTITNNAISLTGLAKGMYLVNVSTDGAAYATAKFVKE